MPQNPRQTERYQRPKLGPDHDLHGAPDMPIGRTCGHGDRCAGKGAGDHGNRHKADDQQRAPNPRPRDQRIQALAVH